MLGFITGHWEVLVIGGVIVLLFFGRRIPEIMRSLGKGVTQFKKGLKEKDDQSDGDAGGVKALPSPRENGPQKSAREVEAKQVKTAAAEPPPKRSPKRQPKRPKE